MVVIFISMKKSIVEYEDYRQFLLDFYEERKRTGAFTWREFSKLAGSSSPSFMKMVCEGKNGLSKLGVERAANALGLSGHELVYFRAMVTFGQSKKEDERQKAYREMLEIASERKVRLLEADSYKFYESWRYPVLRELAPMMPGAKPLEMAKRCAHETSAEDVREALEFLVKAGFLKKTGDNAYEQMDKTMRVSAAAMPLVNRAMHKQMADFAKAAIDEVPAEKRDFSGVTMGVDQEGFDAIVALLKETRKKAIDIATSKEGGSQVYRLNLQLFPLTKDSEA